MNKKSLSHNLLLLLATIISVAINANSQTPHNVVSDFNFHQQIPFSIYEKEGKVYTAGIALPKDGSNNRDPFFVEYDTDLLPSSHALLKDNGTRQATGNNAELIYHSGKLYKGFHEDAFSIEGHIDSYGLIAEYDIANSSTEYFHRIQDSIDLSTYKDIASMSISSDGQLTVLYTSGIHDIHIQSFDLSMGKKLLHNVRYSDPEFDFYPLEILERSFGYLVLGQFTYKFGGEYLGTFIWDFDKEFKVESKRTIDNTNYRNIYLEGIVHVDDNLVIAYNEHEGDLRTFRPLAIKLDRDLNVLWERPIGDPVFFRHNTFYSEVVESHQKDGYLFCGLDEARDSIGKSRGQVAKLSTDGDSIWHRKYLPILTENQSHANLHSIIPSADGNYILSGSCGNEKSAIDSIWVKNWLIKIDEDGHIVLADTTSQVTQLENSLVRVFPNPASDFLYIEHDEVEGLAYELYDVRGRKVLQRHNTRSYTTYMLDLSSVFSGLYYLHMIRLDGTREVEAIYIE